jgi:hypothetical protein
MTHPKYKLVNTETNEILTYSDDNTIHFGGAWGYLQAEGKAGWQDNTIDLSQLKTEKINSFKQITSGELSSTDYKAIKYAEGLYTEEEYAPYKVQRQSVRDKYNAKIALIESCTSKEQLDLVIW